MDSNSGDVRRSTVGRASYVSRDEESSLHAAWKCEGLVKWILFFPGVFLGRPLRWAFFPTQITVFRRR